MLDNTGIQRGNAELDKKFSVQVDLILSVEILNFSLVTKYLNNRIHFNVMEAPKATILKEIGSKHCHFPLITLGTERHIGK
jgi:hypothetical protein